MRYLVDFKEEYDIMFNDHIGVYNYYKYVENLYSSWFYSILKFFKLPLPGNSLFPNSLDAQRLLQFHLWDPEIGPNILFRILFRAFVYSEIRFIHNYIPQGSHEERLTGHLISEIANSLKIVSLDFKKKAKFLYNKPLNLDFYYADMSIKNNEKLTGADFALVFHINLPDYPEQVRVAIVQAKKMETSARIDNIQLDVLKKYAKKNGFYCFYDLNTTEPVSPVILESKIVEQELIHSGNASIKREKILEYKNGSVPLSIFLIECLLNPLYSAIDSFPDVWAAQRFIQTNTNNIQISKVLVITVGGINENNDFTDLRQLLPKVDE